MKGRDVIIGFVVLVVLIAGALYLRNLKNKKALAPSPTPNYQQVESKFPSLTVPENADRANLSVVSGGEGMGEAIRNIKNGTLSLTVIADLESPKPGYFYQAWLSNGTSNISLGKLALAKGGYMVNFTSAKYYLDYNKVVVTLEKVFDSTPEAHVLEGSF